MRLRRALVLVASFLIPVGLLASESPQFLFVKSAESGSLQEVAGKRDTFMLTLKGVAPTTVFFSDRPARISGLAPTDKFLNGFNFSDQNPPNAAIQGVAGDGSSRVMVVALRSPQYDAATATLKYAVTLLPRDNVPKGLAHLSESVRDLPATFSSARGQRARS